MYRPSQTMSCVDEASAATNSTAMQAANHSGVCRASAIRPRLRPPANWNSTTMVFLLDASSRKGLHSDLKTQAKPIRPVQRAIWSFGTPMLLNIRPATRATA